MLTRRQTMAAMAAGTVMLSMDGTARTVDPRRRTTLWYRQPATEWTQALPVGNGRLGAMVFGGTREERLQLNEGTLWAGQPYDPVNPLAREALPKVRELIFAGRIEEAEALTNEALIGRPKVQMPYQALGNLRLTFPDVTEPSEYHRELDLESAIATTRFTAGGVTHLREVIASKPDQVIAVRLSASRPGTLDVDVALDTPHEGAATRSTAREIVLEGANRPASGVDAGLRFAARLALSAKGGRVTPAANGSVSIRGADSVTLLLAMGTSFRRFDDVSGDPAAATSATLAKAVTRGFDRIAADASSEHRRLFGRVSIDLGRTAAADQPTDARIRQSQESDDPALAALYFQYARYLLIACSQPGGQPATLQGLWNDSLNPPWQSKYTININTEMNYWPAHSTNLTECAAPLVQMVRDLAETGARTAREMYGARGWVVHHNTDLWRATAPIDGASWGMWPTGGAWLCTHLWEHYDYTRDRAFLASVYPLMAGSARFFLDALRRDPRTGFLVTNPSLSPENQHGHGGALCAGPTMDMAILRDLFDQTAAAAVLLAIDTPLVAEMRAARARLAPYKISKRGELQEWQEDWDADAPEQDHRHVSHLYGVYPSHQISTDDTPELASAAARTLNIRGDRATGWATAWRINLWARLRDGERAHGILKFLLGPERTYPNMFDAHPPFQIDGNFGGAAGVVEMLMHSHGDVLELLPSLPREWPSGRISGLRARGRCTVDLAWRGGALDRVTLSPEIAGKLQVRAMGRRVDVTLQPGRRVTLDRTSFARAQT
ncbi:glycoside hydrolase N-terminal domain-containing protein [Sphingomonas sp. IW22]|uniref:glycoside hydrolase family 95 protein n=1 Tax=Sphingomonas sp. IW22 TaxID=3242489 RepID=UPI003521D143